MKALYLFILFCFSTVLAQSPGWTSLMETEITVGDNNYDIFTNRYGNHIIVQETNALTYYKMDVEGNTLTSYDLETSSVVSPSITGNSDIIYVVYRKSSETTIITQYSTDGGENWDYLTETITNTSATNIESVVSKDNLHITYQEGTAVKYSRRSVSGGNWTTPTTVSGTYNANNPRIVAWNAGSSDKIYITYNNYNYDRWRGLDVSTGSWSNVDWFIGYGQGFNLLNLGLAVDDTYIYAFHKQSSTEIFSWSVKRISNNNHIGSGNSNGNTNVAKVFTTTNNSDETCTAAWDEVNTPNGIYRMRFDGDASLVYDLIYAETGLDPVNIVNLSSAANDVHVVWQDNFSDGYLRYKYFDDIPLVPENLDVEIYTSGNNNYPKLTWDLNIEPDVYLYGNSIDIYRRISIRGGPWSSWAHLDYADGDQSEYIDYTIGNCYPEANTAEYKIRAIDNGNHTSDFTHSVSINFSQFYKLNHDVVVFEYQLGQNYPNPFNPTTTIEFSIKSAGLVTLKVYDMLGTEVTSLVNEIKDPGNYSINFNAENLPSGIYFYTIRIGNFRETKKLNLLK